MFDAGSTQNDGGGTPADLRKAVTDMAPFVINLASGAPAGMLKSGTYNGTRGVDVTVMTGDVTITSLTIRSFSVGADNYAELGARIYDSYSSTRDLIATSGPAMQVTAGGDFTFPITATLKQGKTYRVCVFGGPVNPDSGVEDNTAMQLNMPFVFGQSGYLETTGTLHIRDAYLLHAPVDSFPTIDNVNVPLIEFTAHF